MNNFEKVTRYIKLLRKYNKLETEYTVLRDDVKNECFKKILEKVGEPLEIKRLRAENRKLRLKNKELKDIIQKGKIISLVQKVE